MSTPTGIREVIWQKTSSFAENIKELSENLTSNGFYSLKSRLKNSVINLPDDVSRVFDKDDNKIEQIRSFIQANGQLEECKNYLFMIDRLRYGNVSELLNQVNEITQMIQVNSRLSI